MKNQKNPTHSEHLPEADRDNYKFIFEHSPDAIFIHARMKKGFGRFIDVNQTACKLLGYSHDELLDMTVKDLMLPMKKEAFGPNETRKKLTKKQDIIFEAMYQPKKDKPIQVEVHSTLIMYNGVEAILSIVRDISVRCETRIALHRKNKFLSLLSTLNDLVNNGAGLPALISALGHGTQELFNSHGATVFMLDESGTELVMQKLVLLKKTFKPLEELLGSKIPDVRLPADKFTVLDKVFNGGEVLLVEDAKEIESLLLEFGNITTVNSKIRKKIIKSIIPKLADFFQIKSFMFAPLGTNENRLGILGISTNQFFENDDLEIFSNIASQVTNLIQRVKMDQALALSEEKFRKVIEQSLEGFALVNEKGTIIQWNNALEITSGLKADECIGQPIWDVQMRVMLKENQTEVVRTILKDQILGFLKTGKIPKAMAITEQKLKHPDGSIRSQLSSLSAFKTVAGYMICAIVRDITERREAEAKLKISETRYRYFVEQTAEGFYRTEPVDPIDLSLKEDEQIRQMYEQTRVIEANDVFARMYKYTDANAICGISLVELYGGTDKQQNLETQRRFIQNGYKVIDAETEEIDQDGNRKYFLNNAVGIIENNFLIGVWGTQRDITDKKIAEMALIESESRFRKVSELTSDYAFGAKVTEDMQLTFEWITGALKKITGYTQEALRAKGGWETLILEEDLHIPYSQFKEVLGGKAQVVEYRIKDKNGDIRWMRDQTEPVWDKELARTIYVFGSVKDITEQKKVEQELVVSEERYKNLFQLSPDAIFIHPFRKKGFDDFIEVNEIACTRLGYSREELLSKSAEDISFPADVKSAGSVTGRNKLSNETNRVFEAIHITKDGKHIPVEIHSTTFMHKGKQIILSVARNISERKRLEEQLRQAQKMEAVGQLAGGVAHDFNNLLTIISGYSELLLADQQLNEKGSIKVKEILKAGDRAQQLTNQLLAFSRKQIFKPRVVKMDDVISNSIKMYTRLIGEDIKIVLKPSKKIPPIMADPHQLEQILMNLLVNSRDAINANDERSSKKTITIKTELIDVNKEMLVYCPGMSSGMKIRLSVSDTGIGIKNEQLKQIFDPFFTTKDLGKGTGLGLSTVYGIVKQNKANIYVDSKPAKGTTFNIYWPPSEEIELEQSDDGHKKELTRGSENLLLVEDDTGVRDFSVSALTSLGYKVYSVSNASEALDMLKKGKKQFGLVLTDVVMPGLSGQDLAQQIKKYYTDLPVIFVSGYTDNHIVNNGAMGKHIHFIQKPFSLAELSKKIQEVLNEKRHIK